MQSKSLEARVPLPFAVFDRPIDKAFDQVPLGGDVDNVDVDAAATRHLASSRGYDLWGSHGAANERRDWSVGLDPTEICLYVGDRRRRIISVNCAPLAVAAVPGALTTLVSGGARALRVSPPREFVYAAVLPDDVERAQMLLDGEVVGSIQVRRQRIVVLVP